MKNGLLDHRFLVDVVDVLCRRLWLYIPDGPCCWNIYRIVYSKNDPNVGNYSSTMKHLGHLGMCSFFLGCAVPNMTQPGMRETQGVACLISGSPLGKTFLDDSLLSEGGWGVALHRTFKISKVGGFLTIWGWWWPWKIGIYELYGDDIFYIKNLYTEVSRHGGTPKWMVYNEKSH